MNGFQSPTGIKRPSLPGGGGIFDFREVAAHLDENGFGLGRVREVVMLFDVVLEIIEFHPFLAKTPLMTFRTPNFLAP